MARKTPFAFKPMPSQAQGIPQRPVMPPGQEIDRSLGEDSVRFMGPPAPYVPPVIGNMGGLAANHDPMHGWQLPDPFGLNKVRGL